MISIWGIDYVNHSTSRYFHTFTFSLLLLFVYVWGILSDRQCQNLRCISIRALWKQIEFKECPFDDTLSELFENKLNSRNVNLTTRIHMMWYILLDIYEKCHDQRKFLWTLIAYMIFPAKVILNQFDYWSITISGSKHKQAKVA